MRVLGRADGYASFLSKPSAILSFAIVSARPLTSSRIHRPVDERLSWQAKVPEDRMRQAYLLQPLRPSVSPPISESSGCPALPSSRWCL
jgi:hypothetical protein